MTEAQAVELIEALERISMGIHLIFGSIIVLGSLAIKRWRIKRWRK